MLLTDDEIQQEIGNSLEVFMGIKHNLPKLLKAQLKKVVDGRPREFDGEKVKLHFTRIEWQALLKEVT